MGAGPVDRTLFRAVDLLVSPWALLVFVYYLRSVEGGKGGEKELSPHMPAVTGAGPHRLGTRNSVQVSQVGVKNSIT